MATTRYQNMNWTMAERTPIEITNAIKTAFCHRCHNQVTPIVINTGYLSKPLRVCPKDRSVIQGNQNDHSNHD